jgi:ABC-type multidrug transport system fused ATPase/permease subunit
MFKILQKNITLLIAVMFFLSVSAYCQLYIPDLLSRGIACIRDRESTTTTIKALIFFYIGRGIAQVVANSLNSYLESSIRIDLTKYIYRNFHTAEHASLMTLIKEDAERVVSAISNILYIFSSAILVATTFYLLITDAPYLSAPLLIIFVLTARHIKKFSTLVAENYRFEINKEETYKHSILTLMKSNTPGPAYSQKKTDAVHKLNEVITARYKYEKTNLKLSFAPEFLIAAATALIVLFVALTSPKSFGSHYIYYLGYLGIFSMASRHSVETALSLIGINESIKRIFKGGNNE